MRPRIEIFIIEFRPKNGDMMYTDLDRMPLRVFIDLICGDFGVVANGKSFSEKDVVDTAEMLISEYIGIVGGRGVTADIIRKNDLENSLIRISCMEACEGLLGAGKTDVVCEIIGAFGFSVPAEDKGKVAQRVRSILMNNRYRAEKAKAVMGRGDERVMDKDYFARERVYVMGHFSMHIDQDVFSAKEYAYMVKKMCDDIERMGKK